MGQWPGGVGRRWGSGRWNREALRQRDIEGHIGSGAVVPLEGAGMRPCDSGMIGHCGFGIRMGRQVDTGAMSCTVGIVGQRDSETVRQ